jgi:hypothetical protein
MFEEPMQPPDPDGEPEAGSPHEEDPSSEPVVLEPELEHDVDPLAPLAATQQFLQRAEAARLVALLDAYNEAMAEMVAVFGTDADDRNGPFARSFLLEAAQLLRVGERTAGTLLDAGQALQRSFPCTWSMFTEGRTTWREVEVVWRQAQGLDPDRLPPYDAEAAAFLTDGTPATRLKERLHRLRERLQADTSAPRHRAAVANRRVLIESAPDGMAWLSLYGDAAELLAFDDALTKAAVAAHGEDGETRTLAQLRHDISRDLLLEGIKQPAAEREELRVPARKGVVPITYLTIPVLSALGHGDEPAHLAGYGPIDLDRAKELAGEAKGWIRILTDPVTGVRLTMDRTVYTPPPDLKRWLRVRDETCRAPGCNRRVATCDIDHVSGWIEDGRTEDGNLAHLCRRHHAMKGSGYWRTTLQADGRMRWRSWWDRLFITEPADQPQPAPVVASPA